MPQQSTPAVNIRLAGPKGRPYSQWRQGSDAQTVCEGTIKNYAMKPTESPGAVAALGASEPDGLRRRVVLNLNRQQQFSQAPIRAVLIRSDRCEAEGIIAYGYAPVLDLCRALIKAGHDPKRALHAYRGEVLALAVRSIGEGAQLTVEDTRGTPHLRRWRDRSRRYGAGSPVAQTDNGQGVTTRAHRATQRAAP
jgi:hypothetical protein